MSGLTVVGDIKVLYDSIEELKSSVKKFQDSFSEENHKILMKILDRLEKVEFKVYENLVLNFSNTSFFFIFGRIRPKIKIKYFFVY